MQLMGAEILFECLGQEKVDVIFGYPGGAVIDIYHALPQYPIEHILVRHEQAAVHAADGYARATGKVGVSLVTSGPGATNTVTGIATAYMDSIPLVVITGQVPMPLIGNDAFQEVDIIGITRSCTKHNYLVRDINDLASTLQKAFYLARTGRPGPVLVDIPKDILAAKTQYKPITTPVKMRSYNPTYTPHPGQIRRAFKELSKAKRPLFYVGGGVITSNATEELSWLIDNCHIPVTATLMGLGAYPTHKPLWLGMLGMHGTFAANTAVSTADVIVAVGARFDDRVTGKISAFAPQAKIIHVDIDPTSIQKNVTVSIPVVADCKEALQAIKKEAENNKDICWEEKQNEWLQDTVSWKKEHPFKYIDDEKIIKPQYVLEELQKLIPEDTIIATEVGQNQMWAAQFLQFFHPRHFLTSGGLGTMGYGLPAAMGAQKAFPNRLVVNVAGDGSIQMNIQELGTLMAYKLPVKILILNNGVLGMVRQWQELFYKKNYSQTNIAESQPDFVKLAEAYGAGGYRITEKSALRETLQKALDDPRAAIIDVQICPHENVYPMVPPGKALTEMLLI